VVSNATHNNLHYEVQAEEAQKSTKKYKEAQRSTNIKEKEEQRRSKKKYEEEASSSSCFP
jgi:hypothetical protein